MKKFILIIAIIFANVFTINAAPCFMFIPEPDDELIIKACEYYGLHHIDYVLAQAKLESGNYKSGFYKRTNNLFGIKRGKNYAVYNNWYESIEDYKNRVQYKYKEGESYPNFLIRINYASAPSYIKYVEQCRKSIKSI